MRRHVKHSALLAGPTKREHRIFVLMSTQINAVDPDLRGFQKRRGKLIEYHGWLDSGFSPNYAVEYYESAVQAVRKQGGIGDESREAAMAEPATPGAH